jgi:UDP-2,3-diacylglucosamine pyrophosphatase LpxH
MPKKYVVISDLHFGDRGPLEDFVYEEEFINFLDYLAGNSQGKNQGVELVINGDFIEFLQVPPLGGRDLNSGISKIKTVLSKHKKAFKKLGAFIAAGNQVRIIQGNHDIELNFPEVRELMADAIAGKDHELKKGLIFHPTLSYMPPGVYIEHGNQYDSRNWVDHDHLIRDEVTKSLNLPWGSRFVIEIFNEVEARYGFIDNIKPLLAGAFIVLILDRNFFLDRVPRFLGLEVEDFFSLLKNILRRDARSVERQVQKAKLDQESVKFIKDLAMVSGGLEHIQATPSQEKRFLKEFWEQTRLKILQHTLPLIESTDRLWEVLRGDPNVETARNLMASKDVKWVVFGHTHGAKKVKTGNGTYLNTGTWTDLMRLPPSDEAQTLEAWLDSLKKPTTYPLVSKLSFVQIDYEKETPKGELMMWKDGKAVVDPGL